MHSRNTTHKCPKQTLESWSTSNMLPVAGIEPMSQYKNYFTTTALDHWATEVLIEKYFITRVLV